MYLTNLQKRTCFLSNALCLCPSPCLCPSIHVYTLVIWILPSHQARCSNCEYEICTCAISTVLRHAAGGCPHRHASISFLPLWGLVGPVRHCGPLLLRRNHLPLRLTQRVLLVTSHHSQCFPDAQLCVGRGHLHLCGDGYSRPPQVAGGGLTQTLCGSFYGCHILILHLLTMTKCW